MEVTPSVPVEANSGVKARVPAAGKVLEGDDQPTLLREDQHYLHYITMYRCQTFVRYRTAVCRLTLSRKNVADFDRCSLFGLRQEKRAIVKKQRDAAAVRCGLKFADIHYKFKSIQAPKARLQSYRHTGAKHKLT